jgi:hypothetical protein
LLLWHLLDLLLLFILMAWRAVTAESDDKTASNSDLVDLLLPQLVDLLGAFLGFEVSMA